MDILEEEGSNSENVVEDGDHVELNFKKESSGVGINDSIVKEEKKFEEPVV